MNYENIKAELETIKNQTEEGKNTAQVVGQALLNILQYAKDAANEAKGETIEIAEPGESGATLWVTRRNLEGFEIDLPLADNERYGLMGPIEFTRLYEVPDTSTVQEMISNATTVIMHSIEGLFATTLADAINAVASNPTTKKVVFNPNTGVFDVQSR